MKIRMQVSIAGPGFTLEPGEVTERFADAEAIRLIEAGHAVPCAGQEVETTTVSGAPERRGRRNRDVVSAHGHDGAAI